MTTERHRQETVDRYFDSEARYWREVYEDSGLRGVIYRRRMATALTWAHELGVSERAAVLEAGCGAGLMTAALAGEGHEVTATDSSAQMVELTRRLAGERGLEDRVRVLAADAHSLPLPSAQFELVTALGVLPWLHDPRAALAELTRVLAPGGWLIVTADSRLRLNLLAEPRENPVLAPLKPIVRAARARREIVPAGGAPSRLYLPRSIDQMLSAAGVTPLRRATLGYGPFTFLGRPVLGERGGLRLNAWLERLARGPLPLLRRFGWHYVVAARKPGP